MNQDKTDARLLPARIIAAALVAGAIDLAWAFSVNAASGVPPLIMLQFIASGLLGNAAFAGGLTTALLGVVCHVVLMIVFSACVCLALQTATLGRLASGVVGLLSGLGLWLVMNAVVVPLSATPPLPNVPIWRTLAEVAVHVLVLGPIVVLILSARRNVRRPA